jgi:hypothetical protein
VTQDFPVRMRDAQDRLEYTSLMTSLPMARI